jgi:hypothetical protein
LRRPVTLYTVRAQQVLAYGGYVEMLRRGPLDLTLQEFAGPPADCEIERIAVLNIRECERPARDMLELVPRRAECQDRYIAIEPALQDILEQPFKKAAEDARRRELAVMAGHKAMQRRLWDFMARPWYVRAWRALRGEVS